MRSRQPRSKPEPTIALINIVFLMLIFFMVAGTLSPPIDPDVKLVDTQELEGQEPAFAIVLDASGNLRYRGAPIDGPEPYLSDLNDKTIARVMPDRNSPAPALLSLAQQLKQAGVEKVMIVTEKVQQ